MAFVKYKTAKTATKEPNPILAVSYLQSNGLLSYFSLSSGRKYNINNMPFF